MYVCNCTGIGEKRLEEIIDDEGARTVGQVFKTHGQKPQCGQCTCEIRDILEDGTKSGKPTKEGLAEWRKRKMNGGPRCKSKDKGAANDKTGDEPPRLRRAM
tara:strand:- start:138 stop:443 length:306 start_codon:yes stop_codon:yes gene_type:complete